MKGSEARALAKIRSMSDSQLTEDCRALQVQKEATTARQRGLRTRVRRLLSEARGRELPVDLMPPVEPF